MNYNFDKFINRKGTYCTQWDFIQDRFGKADVLPFSISDMDFQSPPQILQRLEKHLKHGIFGYTRWNHDSFKSSITHWYKTRFDAKIKPDWIVYSPSVMYTISKLIEILTDENDQIVLQVPAYDAFFKTIQTSNRRILPNPLIYSSGKYSLNFGQLEKLLAEEKTKILLLCNPHNPTGRVWNEQELKTIVELCAKYEVNILSDDIHMDFAFGKKFTPITEVATDLNNVFICTSASKTFNTPALGGSYALIPNDFVREKFLSILKMRDGLSSASIFGMLSIIEGYNQATDWVNQLKQYIYQNHIIVQSFLEKELPILHYSLPESTFLAWIDCSKLNRSGVEIKEALVNIGQVGIMGGDVYGAEDGKFLRMNIGCPKEKLYKGLQGLKKAVDYLIHG